MREAELLGYLPNCIKFERFFDQNGPGISTINLYANEVSRRNDYDLYRKQGKLHALLHFRFTADTTYEQFCEKNILPTEQQFENYSHMIRAVRYDQQWFLKKSIRGRFDENEQFFNRICKWYASHGHWKRNGMFMHYEFSDVLESYPEPTPFFSYVYKMLGNMVLAHKEPKLDLFRICKSCGDIFYAKQRNTMYCSSACKVRHHREKHKKA